MVRMRCTYTPEFKTEAVKFVTEQGYSVAEAVSSRRFLRSLPANSILVDIDSYCQGLCLPE